MSSLGFCTELLHASLYTRSCQIFGKQINGVPSFLSSPHHQKTIGPLNIPLQSEPVYTKSDQSKPQHKPYLIQAIFLLVYILGMNVLHSSILLVLCGHAQSVDC